MEKAALLARAQHLKSEGKSKEEIYLDLLKSGHRVDEIEAAYKELAKKENEGHMQERTVHIILTVGALLIAAGVFSFVASNWQELGRVTKLLILLVAMLTAHGVGFYMKEKGRYLKTAQAFFLVGSTIYGASIFLIAQMFHIASNWPDGFILWMFGAAAFGFGASSLASLWLAAATGLTATIGHPVEFFGSFSDYSQYIFSSSVFLVIATAVTFASGWLLERVFSGKAVLREIFFVLSAAFLFITLTVLNRDIGDIVSWRVLLLITSAVALALAYKKQLLLSLMGGLIGIGIFWIFQSSTWLESAGITSGISVISGVALIGLIYYVLGHMQREKFMTAYVALGFLSVTGLLFYFSLEDGVRSLTDFFAKHAQKNFTASFGVVGTLSLFLVALLFLLWYSREPRASHNPVLKSSEALGVFAFAAIFTALLFMPELELTRYDQFAYHHNLTPAGFTAALVFNVLIFAELTGFILTGYIRRHIWRINLGALLLFIFIIVKYFDWFFTFLDKSVFFISAGAVLFIVGFLMERGRRYMLHEIHSSH